MMKVLAEYKIQVGDNPNNSVVAWRVAVPSDETGRKVSFGMSYFDGYNWTRYMLLHQHGCDGINGTCQVSEIERPRYDGPYSDSGFWVEDALQFMLDSLAKHVGTDYHALVSRLHAWAETEMKDKTIRHSLIQKMEVA